MKHKLDIDDWKNRCNLKFKNKYDYSLINDFNYINNKTNVKIICPIHGMFEQTTNGHFDGNGCKKCFYDSRRSNKDNIILKFNNKHGNKYDYSLVEYINNKVNIKIICPEHGVFEQSPINHIRHGCSKCSDVCKKTIDEFISDSEKIWNKYYDYSLVEYINLKTKVKIICPEHGIFEQRPIYHINGSGCKLCVLDYSRKENNKFISDSKKVHGEYYNYNICKYINARTKVDIICPKHGIFKQNPRLHQQGKGCPICKQSKGEVKIREFLIKNKIVFEQQKSFNDCKYKSKLRFDFWVPSHNLCIEYDGEQHFRETNYSIDMKEVILKDSIKNTFCASNNTKLLRIPFTEFKNIENILKCLFDR